MYVFLPYKVINQIKHDTIRVAPKEVGGYLLGVTLGEDRFVTHAIASSQPGTKVEATIATPVMMPLYQPYLERYGGEVLAIGIFHSHPHHFLSYSPTDVEMHINMEQWDSKDLISIVIDPYKEENAFTVMSLDEKGTVLKVPVHDLPDKEMYYLDYRDIYPVEMLPKAPRDFEGSLNIFLENHIIRDIFNF